MYRNMALFSTYLGRALTERAYKRWELEVVSSILTPPQSGDGLMAERQLVFTAPSTRASQAYYAVACPVLLQREPTNLVLSPQGGRVGSIPTPSG